MFYPGGEFLPKQAKEGYDAGGFPGGTNTFVPGSTGWQASGGQGKRNPDMEGKDVPSAGQNYDAEDARETGTDGTGIDFEGRKGPRTVTIEHPGRDLSKTKYIDPEEAYAARYCSFSNGLLRDNVG